MKRILVLASLAFGLAESPVVAPDVAEAMQLTPPPPLPPMPSAKPTHRFVDMGSSSRRAKASAVQHKVKREAEASKPAKTKKALASSSTNKKSEAGTPAKTSKKALASGRSNKKSEAGKNLRTSKSAKLSKSLRTSKSAKLSKSLRTSESAKASEKRRAGPKEAAVHFSAKTVRSCHAMTYRQIMKSSSCRAMIKQELAAAPAKHRTSAKEKSKTKLAAAKKRSGRRSGD